MVAIAALHEELSVRKKHGIPQKAFFGQFVRKVIRDYVQYQVDYF
jgi:hypothetical protein